MEAKETQYIAIDDELKAANLHIAESKRTDDIAQKEHDAAQRALTNERQSHKDLQLKSQSQVSDHAAHIRTLEMQHAAQLTDKEERYAAQFNERDNDIAHLRAVGKQHAAQIRDLLERRAAQLNELEDPAKRHNRAV